MTLDEKIAEVQATTKDAFMDNYDKDNGEFNIARARVVFKHGMGRISAIFHTFSVQRSVEVFNELQAFIKKETRLGIPVITDGEGLHGVICHGGTSYAQAIALGATWNPDLVEKIGVAVGIEARIRGMHQVLSPVLDIARDARAGRTEETYGEDTHLVTRMSVAFINGVQSQRVVTTPKHYLANFVGDGGRDSHPVHYSERLLREIYLPPFEAAIREAGALSVMSAYHSLDGMPCTANKWLLTDVLRGEWGFKGQVVSDWGATEQVYSLHYVAKDLAEAGEKTINSGMDQELPFSRCFKHLPELVRKGRVKEEVLDKAVRRSLYLKFWSGLFEQKPLSVEKAIKTTNCKAHKELALESARQSIVLLKNNDFLPLRPTIKTLAVIGPNAARKQLGGYASIKPETIKIISPLEGIKDFVSSQTEVLYAEGCPNMGEKREGFEAALKIARKADAVVMVMGNFGDIEGEQKDRSNLDLIGLQEELILEVAKVNPKVAVVLIGGSAITMMRWIDKVPAIVMAWYPGQEGGTAIAEVLFGKVNPSGKLPISFPKVTGQCPFYYNTKPSGRVMDYSDLRGPQAQFAFGHGLSYTTFKYDNQKIKKTGSGKNQVYTVSLTVTNTGKRAGDEVVQLYIHDEISNRSRPIMELKGFKRISLKPGQKMPVKFQLSWKDVAYLGDDMKPTLEPGNIEFMVGSSSHDIRFRLGSTHKLTLEIENYECSPLLPTVPDIRKMPLPAQNTKYSPAKLCQSGPMRYTDVVPVHEKKDGSLFIRTKLTMLGGKGQILFGADGPVRIWVNRKQVACLPNATNPILRDQYVAAVKWQPGENEIIFGMNTNSGRVMGVCCRAVQM